MFVPYNYLPFEFSDNTEILEDWKSLIETTEFTLGPFLTNFEKKFSGYMGQNDALAVNCGTDALILALRALEIGPGDEVITVTNTFYATVGAIAAVGATAVLVDCDNRFQIDVRKIQPAITKNTRAVMPVHWGGASPEMSAIAELCIKHNLLMIEDACMGIGGIVDGKQPGSFGDASAFSMHPLKSLNAMGDGGAVVFKSKEKIDWARRYRNHGMVDRDHIEFWGVNMRMQPLQCVVLSRGLDRLDDTIQKRNENAAILDDGLHSIPDVTLPSRPRANRETFALYMGLFENRDGLAKFLKEHGVETKIHYPLPLHKQKAAQSACRFDASDMAESEQQAKKLLTLPVHQFVGEAEMEYTVDLIRKFYDG